MLPDLCLTKIPPSMTADNCKYVTLSGRITEIQHVGAPRGYKVLADESSARVIVGSTR